MSRPRLRDSKRSPKNEPYGLNEIPNDLITRIGASLVYLIHTGRKDLGGDDFGDVFARAIGGQHLARPLGIADVVLNRMAWSVKTVKDKSPLVKRSIRLISGRCSPDFSYNITDPHEDVQRTGNAVLNIWNERVNIAQEEYSPLRTVTLIRSYDLLAYTIFEEENHRFRISDYEWKENRNGNLVGVCIETGEESFVWQPHGSQFTILTKVPPHAKKFKLKKPPVITQDSALRNIGFDASWVEIL